MPLDDISAFFEWVRRDDPSADVLRAVRSWEAGLGTRPWRAPSEPHPEVSNQPISEIRSAFVPDSGRVLVVYQQTRLGWSI